MTKQEIFLSILRRTFSIDQGSPIAKAGTPSGFYNQDLSLGFSCEDIGVAGCSNLHYTLDGSVPSSGSLIYTRPFIYHDFNHSTNDCH